MNPSQFNIVAVFPFWRYAVSPGNPYSPGLAYYSLKSARRLFEKAKVELPHSTCFLLKRRSIFSNYVEVIDQYIPEIKNFDDCNGFPQ